MPQPDDLAEQNALALAGAKPERESEGELVNGRAPQPLGGLWTRTLDGWGVDQRWLQGIALNPDKVLTLEGYSADLTVFANLLDDDVAMSAFQQRRLDVISRDWIVEPGADDALSVKAADHLREQLKQLPWDEICDKMLFARWFGYAVGEAIWQIGADGLLKLAGVYVPNPGWFGFSNAGQLLLRSPDQPDGEPVPERKFWLARAGAYHDGLHYGVGLAHWCYWPVYFKKNVVKFWAVFLEKFGMPTLLGKFPAGWEQDEAKIAKLLTALSAVGTDSAVAVPMDAEVAPMEGTRSGSGASSYSEFFDEMNSALTRVILTQTMTTEAGPAGLGSGQANVHEAKGLAIAQADSDLLHESFNNSIGRWLTEWNFPGAACPRVYRKLTDDEDVDAIAERDTKLEALGWVRTEESFKEVYGDGYERKPEPVLPPSMLTAQGQPGVPPVANDNRQPNRRQLAFAAQFAAVDEPRPLYIQRKLLNGAELVRWAESQGFTNVQPVDELHVTQLYCRKPVDWFALASRAWWSAPDVVEVTGGPRTVMPLGDVIVLRFGSQELEGRFASLTSRPFPDGEEQQAGLDVAEHSHPEFVPHVTFAADASGVPDLGAVEPFQGVLRFGPEIWEPLQDDLQLQVPAVTFAAQQLDAVDRIVEAMGREGTAAIRGMVQPVRDALAGMDATTDPEALRFALLEALEGMDTEAFARVLADPLVAVRAAEESGLGVDSVA